MADEVMTRAQSRRHAAHGGQTARTSRSARSHAYSSDHPTLLERRRGRTTHHRNLTRLRRIVVGSLVALLIGTAFARAAQDPSVAFPRPGRDASSQPWVAQPLGGELPAAALSRPAVAPTTTAAAPASTTPTEGPTAQPEVTLMAGGVPAKEDGASEPVPAPGQTLAPVLTSAGGTVHPVEIATTVPPKDGRIVRYSVEVEDGLEEEQSAFATAVQGVLHHPRGWQAADGVRFVAVSAADVARGAPVDIRVTLATPALTSRLCAPLNTTNPEVSCWAHGRAVLNLQRWVRGSVTYGDDLVSYRTYLVNHEVGHGLGHGHVRCVHPGAKAPIMVQQTKGLEGCTAWPWPTAG